MAEGFSWRPLWIPQYHQCPIYVCKGLEKDTKGCKCDICRVKARLETYYFQHIISVDEYHYMLDRKRNGYLAWN